MTEADKLLVQIGTACDAISRKTEQTSLDYMIYGVLMNCSVFLKEQEAKYGYWINPTSQECHCSECGEQPVHEPGESVPLYDYCPYCGAKMEVKWNE